MARYSIEILDGERRGDVVALSDERFTIGRKPGNSLVLKDESLSGVHAEIVVEAGSVILRDLGSTNGTKIDGKKIDEVPLSHGDEIHLGKVKVRFVAEGGSVAGGTAAGGAAAADAAGGDLAAVIKIDHNALARAGKRRGGLPIVALLLVVVALAGGAYWYFVLSPGGESQRPGRRQPLQVAGNMLSAQAADFETEGAYDLAAGGAGFALGTRAHSGRFALEAQLSAESPWAVARLLAPVAVTPGSGLKVMAHVAGSDTARAGVRLLFGVARTAGTAAPAGEGTPEPRKRPMLTTGGMVAPDQLVAGPPLLTLGDAFQGVEAAVEVPPGVDQCAVLVVAAGTGTASVDDVSVVTQTGTFASADVAGRRLTLDTGWPTLKTAEGLLIRSISPVARAEDLGDPALKGLAAAGLLVFADLGQPAKAAPEGETSLRLSFAGSSGLQVRLVVPAEHVQGIHVLTTAEGAPPRWSFQPPQFQVPRGQAVLSGSKLKQFRATVPAPGAISGTTLEENVVLLLPGDGGTLDVQVAFAKEQEEVARKLTAARNAARQGKAGDARAKFLAIEEELPFDETALEEARREGATLKTDFVKNLQEVDKLLQDARFFDNRGTFEVVQQRLTALASVQQGSAQDLAEIDKRQAEVKGRLDELRTAHAWRRSRSLLDVAKAFETDQQAALSQFVLDYVKRRHPAALTGDGPASLPGNEEKKK